jgi:hypothetical protein
MGVDTPFMVRWTDFNTIQFSYTSRYNPSTHSYSPEWVTLGTFNKAQEHVTGDAMVASVFVENAAGGLMAVRVKLQYKKDAQMMERVFATDAKFGCQKQ